VRRQLLSVSTLRAGNQLVAVNVVHRWGRQTIDRVTTYEPRFRKYSPGAIHFRYLLRHSFESGDEEFDFLWGEEPYKYRYATHVRWLGDVGREPRVDRWRRRARMRAGRALRRYPGVYGPVQKAELAARRALGRVVR
jgi:CelD/BcsL family acetyltransferase involved in cellulose biosynthesis